MSGMPSLGQVAGGQDLLARCPSPWPGASVCQRRPPSSYRCQYTLPSVHSVRAGPGCRPGSGPSAGARSCRRRSRWLYVAFDTPVPFEFQLNIVLVGRVAGHQVRAVVPVHVGVVDPRLDRGPTYVLTLAKTLYAPSPTQSRTPHDTMPTSLPPITSGPPESPLQAVSTGARRRRSRAVLPAQTMWPERSDDPYEPPARRVGDDRQRRRPSASWRCRRSGGRWCGPSRRPWPACPARTGAVSVFAITGERLGRDRVEVSVSTATSLSMAARAARPCRACCSTDGRRPQETAVQVAAVRTVGGQLRCR